MERDAFLLSTTNMPVLNITVKGKWLCAIERLLSESSRLA
jgi:hypothetical protein